MTLSDRRGILLHILPSFDSGGVQTRFAIIANRLGRKFSHRILALDDAYGARQLIAPEVDHEILKHGLDKTASLANLPKYRRIIRASGADLMVTYNWGAIEWAFANLTGIVAHVHIEDGFGPEEAEKRLLRRNWFRRVALSRSAAVVVPSRTLYGIAAREWKVPSRRLRYIPNGIDWARFAREPERALVDKLQLPAGLPVVGALAPLRREKNLGRLIRAFAAVIEDMRAHLVIVGEGAERRPLEQLAAERGIAQHVTFAGHLSGPERILGAFDLFGISSDTEQMPFSVLEAMAAGLPVAGVDVGDVKTMVSEANAPFIVARDEGQLANAIRDLLQDPERAQSTGAANRARVRQDFDQASMVSAYDEVLGLSRRSAL